jgi:hypothetical protein
MSRTRTDGPRFYLHSAVVLGSSSSYGVGNRAAFSDSRSNFHTRVGYRTNVCRRRLASDLARASEDTPAQGALEDHHDRLPGSPHHRSNLCGVSVCYRVVMLKLLLALVISSLAVEQPLMAQTAARQEPISTAVVRQRTAEVEVERNLQTMRLSSGLPHLKRVPASESEVELTCTAAQTGQEVHDPELGNLRTYVTSDLAAQTEQLKLVALGTSQFPDGGPRRPVYSDKGWPRYSVVVFLDESSTPGHAFYRVGVARRPSAFAEWLAPISGDNPVKDAKEWKGQVVPACRRAQ